MADSDDTVESCESEEEIIYNRADSDSDEDDGDDSDVPYKKYSKPPPVKKRRIHRRYDDDDKMPNLCDYMIDRHYRPKWKLEDGIRELVQNTIDGAFCYANAKLGITSPRQLQPSIDRRMKKPPKAIGLKYGYSVTFILSAAGVDNTNAGKKKEQKSPYFDNKWMNDKKAVACIRCLYGTNSQFEKKDIQNWHLPGSLLYSFEVENRAIEFGIKKILTLGKTSKRNSTEQAGKFGEGLKIGAVSILRRDFKLEIQGNDERCRFEFRKSRMTKEFTLHAKMVKSTKRYRFDENPQLVGAKITRSTKKFSSRQHTMITHKEDLRGVKVRFPHENFRVLSLTRTEGAMMGKRTKDELLLSEQDRKRIFCKSIFVEKKDRLLFGYDFQDLDLPMERNYVGHGELLRKAGKLLADLLFDRDLEDGFKKKIKDEIVKMLEGKHSRDFVEAQILYDDDGRYDKNAKLAKEIMQYFESLHGKNAFPCDKSQKNDVEERLPERKPHVVSETFLHILKRGGYRSLKDEENALYSEQNKTEKPVDKSPFSIIVTKALLRLTSSGLKSISRDSIVFLQEAKLPKTRSTCKKKEEVIYVNDRVLLGNDIEEESYMLAYHLIRTLGDNDMLMTFIRDRNKPVELEFELKASMAGEQAINVSISQALHLRADVDIVVRESNKATVILGPVATGHSFRSADSKSSGEAKLQDSEPSNNKEKDVKAMNETGKRMVDGSGADFAGAESIPTKIVLVSEDSSENLDTQVAAGNEVLFRQNCAEQRKFRVAGLKAGTRYTVEAVNSNLELVIDSHTGEFCRAYCWTDLTCKDPSDITVRCFKGYQTVLASGARNLEIGFQYFQDTHLQESERKFVTQWQEEERKGIRLNLKEGSPVKVFSRRRDESTRPNDRIVSSIQEFGFAVPSSLDRPPAPTIAELWNTKSGCCTISVAYPVELPPRSKLIVCYKQITVDRSLKRSASTYVFDFQLSKSVKVLAYLAVPVGQAIVEGRTKVWLISDGIDVVSIEKESVGLEQASVSSDHVLGAIDDGIDSDDDDGYAEYGRSFGTSSESEKQDDDSDYGEDLKEAELDHVFEFKDENSEYSPEDDLDDPSVNISEDSCEFEGRAFLVGETYFSDNEQKWYTIVRLFPQRKPPKAECEVDMFLRDTFVGISATDHFVKNYKVRCEQLATVSLGCFTTLVDERPRTSFVLQRDNHNKRAFAFYFDNDCDSVASIEKHNRDVCGLELFAGIGGMSCGFIDADLPVKWLVENNDLPAANLKQNHPDSVVFVERAEEFLRSVKSGKQGYPRRGQISFLHLSPPCQGYSLANRNGGQNDKDNNNLTNIVIDFVLALDPPLVVMENVTAILHEGKSDIFRGVIAQLLREDYQVRVCVLKACDFGDAQNRSRMFLLAAKKGYDLPMAPRPTHGTNNDRLLEAFVSVKDAIGDLGRPSREASVVECPANRKLTYNHKITQRRPSDKDVKKLEPNELAPTTISSTRLMHYDQDRLLTIREYMRLHSFPDRMQLFGAHGPLMKAIGNAVPVKLATAVAKCIKKSLQMANPGDEDEY